jgi:hypothetical protein
MTFAADSVAPLPMARFADQWPAYRRDKRIASPMQHWPTVIGLP